MIVNRANLDGIYRSIKTEFNKAFSETSTFWQQTTMKIQSSSSENQYNWMSNFPKLVEWLGDKAVKNLSAFKYTIVNKSYEATIEVDRDDIEDDNLGMYAMMAGEYGLAAAEWPDDLDAALKNNAFTSLCFDGQYFYDTDHPVINPSTGLPVSTSNKGTAALSAATTAAAIASYGAARTALMTITSDEGSQLALMPDLLEVPPALEATGKILLESDKLTDESPNPYKGTARLLVNPRLTSSTAWFLHVTNRRLKPFIFQERKKPVFVKQDDMNNPDVFMRKKYKYGVEARGNAGYGLWQLSYGSTGAA